MGKNKLRRQGLRVTAAQRAILAGDPVRVRINCKNVNTFALTAPRRTNRHRWSIWLSGIDGACDLAYVRPGKAPANHLLEAPE